jgi:hypothetical protein
LPFPAVASLSPSGENRHASTALGCSHLHMTSPVVKLWTVAFLSAPP